MRARCYCGVGPVQVKISPRALHRVGADVQTAVAENFNPRCATLGKPFKENFPTLTATRPAVGDEGGIASSRCAKGIGGVEIGEEYRFAAAGAG